MKTTAVDQVLCHIISILCSSPTDQGLANFFLKRERPYFRFHRPYSFCGSRRWWTCCVPIKLYFKKKEASRTGLLAILCDPISQVNKPKENQAATQRAVATHIDLHSREGLPGFLHPATLNTWIVVFFFLVLCCLFSYPCSSGNIVFSLKSYQLFLFYEYFEESQGVKFAYRNASLNGYASEKMYTLKYY